MTNGYFITTSLDLPSGDMSEWIIESTPSNWSQSKSVFQSALYNLQLPVKRGADFVFDYSVEEPFFKMLQTNQFIFSAGFLLSVVLGAVGRETDVPAVLVATFLLSAVERTVAGLGFLIVTGNSVGYWTIWITTPQVCLVSCFSGMLSCSSKTS